jgi:lysyl endopeptidase
MRLRAPRALLLAAAALLASPAAAAPALPDLPALATAPRLVVAPAAVERALALHPPTTRPWSFAAPVALPLSLEDGRWTPLPGGARRWQLRLHSAGARSLSLHLAGLALPAGASLRTYDPRALTVHAYDARHVTPGGLWTPPVAGDELVLELLLPPGAGLPALGAARLFHGYRGWKADGVDAKAAGECNVDITCAQGSDWLAEARSVALITVDNRIACTGQLLNNVQQDKRRLFLTANHCGIDAGGGPADSVNFYFNYVGPCGDNTPQPQPPPSLQTSDLLASDVQSDFALLEITDNRPLPAGAHFSGWDATTSGATASGASIHHPVGEEKKISLFDTGLSMDSIAVRGIACAVDAWRVQWSEGTTEVGSSGGGLWNSEHRLIGTLSGGNASCSTPDRPDYFARFERGWTANPAASGQLKAHLDPLNTCIAEIPGLDATTPALPFQRGDPARKQRCEGTASNCAAIGDGTGGGGGGGAPGFLPALLAALLLRRCAQKSRVRVTVSL